MFVIGEAAWFPIALYVPALTFNQVTGIGVHTITPVVCAIVTFYTCVVCILKDLYMFYKHIYII